MKIAICPTCKSIREQQLTKAIRFIFPQAEMEYGCQSFCGPGRNSPFVVIDRKIISAASEEALLQRLWQCAQAQDEEIAYDNQTTPQGQTLS